MADIYLDTYLTVGFPPVTLKDTDSWVLWLPYIKLIAKQHGIWDLCNPSQKTPPGPLEAPKGLITIDEAIEKYKSDWYHVRRCLEFDWRCENDAYMRKEKGVYQVLRAIRATVDAMYLPLILVYECLWELLGFLHRRFAPENNPGSMARLRRQREDLERAFYRNRRRRP